jgi:predicted DNA-binding transcriptional regulator AlpA
MKDGWIYGVKAIAGFLGVSRSTLQRMMQAGETDLPVFKIGGRWGAHPGDLRRWKRQVG